MPHLTIDKEYRLHYQLIAGDRKKPYLVFLHEGLGCVAMWKDFPQLLCQDTGCPGLVYDRLGYGQSSSLQTVRTIHYLHRYALTELPTLLEKIIPQTPCILIGHSDGGSIALITGAERPPLLQAIITEAAHVFVDAETIAGIHVARRAWDKGKLAGLTKYHGDKTERIFKAWSDTWLSDWFNHWNIEYLLPSVLAPLLVIQGRDDQYGTTAQAQTIARQCAGCTHLEIIEKCGHTPHQEARSTVLEMMSGFINRTLQTL